MVISQYTDGTNLKIVYPGEGDRLPVLTSFIGEWLRAVDEIQIY